MREIVSGVLLSVGIFFFFVSTVGLLRLPDVFCRIHATAKGDTLGAGCVLLALALFSGNVVTILKLLFIVVFLWITSPTAAHCIAKGIYRSESRQAKGGSD